MASIQDVATVQLQRSPLYDGTSGLHYSGRLYMNQFDKLAGDICKGAIATAAQVGDVMPGGISRPDLPIDNTTMRISQTALSGYVNGLVASKQIPEQMSSITDQVAADRTFYDSLRKEYCFYEARYKAALAQLIDTISAPGTVDQGQVSGVLTSAKALNMRLNSLLEIMNHVGNDRAQKVNVRNKDIDTTNTRLQTKVAQLKSQREFLSSSDVRVRTQEEMVRYSAEKNRAMSIQIMFFVALNVVALGTVLTVYKGMGPGA